MYLLARESASA